MSACACIGPVGDCPCIRRSKGLPVPITETYIAPDLFALLPDADKETINRLKTKALGLHLSGRRGGSPGMAVFEAPVEGCQQACGLPVDPEIQRLAGVALTESAGSPPVQDWQEAALRVCRAVLAQTAPAREPTSAEIDEVFYRLVSPGLPQAEIDALRDWFHLGAREFFAHRVGAIDRPQTMALLMALEAAAFATNGEPHHPEVVAARKAVCEAVFGEGSSGG